MDLQPVYVRCRPESIDSGPHGEMAMLSGSDSIPPSNAE